MTSIDVLASKIDDLATMQKEHQQDMKQLTNAVTTLVQQAAQFERARSEDHKRMDKIDARHEALAGVVGQISSQISEYKPINDLVKYAIMIVLSSVISAGIAITL